MKKPQLFLTILALSLTVNAARAENTKLDRLDETAQTSFDQGDFKRAVTNWNKLLTELGKDSESLEKEEQLARKQRVQKVLRALGQCALEQKDYVLATDLLNQSRTASVELAQPDPSLDQAFTKLSENYREIDPTSLGQEAANALKEVGASKIGVAKTDGGEHIQVVLADKVVKPISANGVSHVGFDKVVSFDFSETPDGTVKIDNISGLKAKVKVWVDIIASKLTLDQDQKPMAQVTGAKMGMSQSVSTQLPDEIYQPLIALISRVKNVFTPGGMAPAGSPIDNVATGQTPPVENGSNQVTPASTIVPVVNSGQPQNNDMDAAPAQ